MIRSRLRTRKMAALVEGSKTTPTPVGDKTATMNKDDETTQFDTCLSLPRVCADTMVIVTSS